MSEIYGTYHANGGSETVLPVATNGGHGGERDVFHVTFDPEKESVGEVIVQSVAAIQNELPCDLDPLYDAIDPDSLDELILGGNTQHGIDNVTFEYQGMEIMLEPSGDLWIQWR